MAKYDNPWEFEGTRKDGYWKDDPKAYRGKDTSVQERINYDKVPEPIHKQAKVLDAVKQMRAQGMSEEDIRKSVKFFNPEGQEPTDEEWTFLQRVENSDAR